MNAKLTPNQKRIIRSLQQNGDLYTNSTSDSYKTFESLVKRGIVLVVSQSEYGKTYRLVDAKAEDEHEEIVRRSQRMMQEQIDLMTPEDLRQFHQMND